MAGFRVDKLHAVKKRLTAAIAPIVERHRTHGHVLTWRLAHEIEDEALKNLEEAGDLDKQYLQLMRSSTLLTFPNTDRPVDLSRLEILPAAFSIIEKAYRTVH